MKKRKSHALVLGFLERISSEAFEEFPRQITELIGKQHGIYAFYNSPSMAGHAIVHQTCGGWHFWKVKNAEGQWVPLDALRKK